VRGKCITTGRRQTGTTFERLEARVRIRHSINRG
jgi:hypothetical protein